MQFSFTFLFRVSNRFFVAFNVVTRSMEHTARRRPPSFECATRIPAARMTAREIRMFRIAPSPITVPLSSSSCPELPSFHTQAALAADEAEAPKSPLGGQVQAVASIRAQVREHRSALIKGKRKSLGAYGLPFTDPESIWEALRAQNGTATVLVRGSWLRKQPLHRRLPRRGSLPPEATIGVDELQSIYANSRKGAEQCAALPVIAVSQAWRSASDPDPDGQVCFALIEALNARWPEFARWGCVDIGLFIYYSSLHQEPRDLFQQMTFECAIQSLPLWYAHARTTVWFVTTGGAGGSVASPAVLKFGDGGWAVFEWALALLLTPTHTGTNVESTSWPMLVDLSYKRQGKAHPTSGVSVTSGTTSGFFRRPPPPEPRAFFEGHAFGAKAYDVLSERDTMAAPLFHAAVLGVLGSAPSLHYARQHWQDADMCALVLMLPLCTRLQTLMLATNAIGDAGVCALARLFDEDSRALPMLTLLDLSDNRIAEAGLSALGALLHPHAGVGATASLTSGARLTAIIQAEMPSALAQRLLPRIAESPPQPPRAPLPLLRLLNLSGNVRVTPEAYAPLRAALVERRIRPPPLPGIEFVSALRVLDTDGRVLGATSQQTSPQTSVHV